MGYLSNGLSFRELRSANVTRRKEDFRNCKDWEPADWLTAMIGELGEAANILKKVRRGDFSLEEVKEKVGYEFGDAMVYFDLWADSVGIDLGAVTMEKFNIVSDRIGSPVKFGHDCEWHRYYSEKED